MPYFRISVYQTVRDTYYVKADSAEQAEDAYYEGDLTSTSGRVLDEDVTTEEVAVVPSDAHLNEARPA